MKRGLLLFSYFLILACFPTLSSGKELAKIAIWDLEPRNIPETHARELTSFVVSEITKLKKYWGYSDSLRAPMLSSVPWERGKSGLRASCGGGQEKGKAPNAGLDYEVVEDLSEEERWKEEEIWEIPSGTCATGASEEKSAQAMLRSQARRGIKPRTLGGDKGYEIS